MIAEAQPVVQCQSRTDFPLILGVPLQEPDLIVSEWPRSLFGIAVEISNQRIGIRVPRASQRSCEAAACAEVKGSRPVPARSFAVKQPFEIGAEFVAVVTANKRQIVRERRKNVVFARLAPAVEPVNVSGGSSYAGPAGDSRDQVEMIVLWEELGSSIVQCRAGQFVGDTGGRYESFGVMPQAEIEFVDQARPEDVDPVGRHPVIRVKIMRADPPPVRISAWPS